VIKAIFFDWFNTLASYNPSREELYYIALKNLGLEVSLKNIHRGLMKADQNLAAHVARDLLKAAKFDNVPDKFREYPRIILAEAGKSISDESADLLVKDLLKQFKPTWAIYEDVIPCLEGLKEKKFTLGIISNAEKNIEYLCETLGLRTLLDVIVTSDQVGAEKPAAPIFLAALNRAGAKPDETLFVGDQYHNDVLGARGVGMRPVLIDRFDSETDVHDCPRISDLTQLEELLTG
jgi:putative hydrolase of the HAD superfamily